MVTASVSVEHWITWRTGLSGGHAHTLVQLAAAQETHPRVAEAFAAGELSIDQARLAVRAQPEHDGDIAEWAKAMTLSQLRVAVRASITSAGDRSASAGTGGTAADRSDDSGEPAEPEDSQPEPDAPAPAAPAPSLQTPSKREYFSLVQDDDGSWRVHGHLDADHGAILDAALAEARDRLFREGRHDVTWADALVDIAERSLDGGSLERRERFRINIFFDPEHSPSATWTNGINVPDAIAKLCACDGVVSPVFVAEGRAVSVGRSQRIVPERTRRIVLHRDKQCRNPMCGAIRGLEVHHIVHWSGDDGPSDTWNLVALCRRCHRDHHLGRLDIGGNADEPDGLIFRDEFGRVIDTATHAVKPPGPPPSPQRPYRHPVGERLQRWAIQFNPPRPNIN